MGHGFAGWWAARGIVVRGRLSCPDGGGAKQNCPIAILYTPSVLPDIFPARGEIERSSAFAKLHRRRSGGGVETADLPPCGYVILMLRWSTPTPSRLRRDTSPPIDGVEERRQAFCRQRSSSNAPLPFPPEGGKVALRSSDGLGEPRGNQAAGRSVTPVEAEAG